MTEQEQESQEARVADQGPRTAPNVGGEGSTLEEAPSEPVEGETFSREYVQQLREEAASHRVKAKRAEALEMALREASLREAAGPILEDVTDLAWSDTFEDEETGLPSSELIRQAAEELAERKPHLARVRGDIGQGRRVDVPEGFNLAEALRLNS